MRSNRHMSSFGLGSSSEDAQVPLPSKNHATTASTAKIAKEASSRGFRRVAGNVYICPAKKDYWGVKNNKLVRLTSSEIDHGESIEMPTARHPQGVLDAILGDLSF